jgi:hypothetical protein
MIMKNRLLLYLSITLLTGLWSCKNEEAVFEKTADERLNEALATYQKDLSSAEFGWKGIIYPGAGGSYSFYFKFNDQNRVVMYSDFDKTSAVTAKESSYRLKAIQQPSLIFDTYSYLHVLADPDGSVNGGGYGEGLKSDFEFTFQSDSTGIITLIGTKNQSKLILTKATQEESVAYGNGGLGKSLLFSNIANYLTYFKRITIGGITYEISVNQNTRKITLNWLVGTTVNSFTTDYYYSSVGVSFVTPFVNGSQTINGFTNITWDATKLSLGLTAAGSAVTVVEAAKPLKIDVAAPRRWFQAPIEVGGYWQSWDGFHANGVDDAFKVNNMKVGTDYYYYYFYWPQFGSNYDAFGPAFVRDNSLALIFADAPNSPPTFTTDGRVVFSNGGTLGTYPTDQPAAISSRNQLYDTSGYYLVQITENAYDMVSAKDGKTWISWLR